MWPFILKYWQPIAAAVATAALVGTLGTAYQNFRVDQINLKHEKEQKQALDDLTVTMFNSCEKQKTITKEVSHEYQTRLADLNDRVVQLRRTVGAKAQCVPVAGSAAGSDDAAASVLDAGGHGVDAGYLIDFAGEAERYRQQVIGLQSFVTREREP